MTTPPPISAEALLQALDETVADDGVQLAPSYSLRTKNTLRQQILNRARELTAAHPDPAPAEAIVCSIHDGKVWFWVADWRADIGDSGAWLTRDKMVFAGEAASAPGNDVVLALVAKWRSEAGQYPNSAIGSAFADGVRLCAHELEAALATPQPKDAGAGQEGA